MTTSKMTALEKTGFVLVLLMILLQGGYGIAAYLDPVLFSNIRGTTLFSELDSDWVRVYGSRTIFITLLLCYFATYCTLGILLYCDGVH